MVSQLDPELSNLVLERSSSESRIELEVGDVDERETRDAFRDRFIITLEMHILSIR